MKTRGSSNSAISLLVALGIAAAALPVLGQAPIISSLSQNGQLVCTNLQPGSTASVEWASSPAGPWTNNWAGLDAVTVDSNGIIQVSVPMFYRVRGIPLPPPGMAPIPAGSFTMGDMMGDTLGQTITNEFPLRTVNVSAFFMDKHEVTGTVWDSVKTWATNNGYVFENAEFSKAPEHPVVQVSFYDAPKFCNARSEMEVRTPAYYVDAAMTHVLRTERVGPYVKWVAGYRLPTEAEWEKAARGGVSGHRFPWSDADTISHARANYRVATSSGTNALPYDVSPTSGDHPLFNYGELPWTNPVGFFAPNEYGLHDMAGNVLEWCWDWYAPYAVGTQTDPHGVRTGTLRVIRGGSHYNSGDTARVSYRGQTQPASRFFNLGFRSVLPQGQ